MSVFKFKEFHIHQDKSAMKVGTDGVLLGAWSDLEDAQRILDIGSGTGLLALMAAQRSYAELIDAIEINEEAFQESVQNFEESPWGDRLFCYHTDFETFVEEMMGGEEYYDHIISNPPYFTSQNPSKDSARATARAIESLPFDMLVEGVSVLLEEGGKFSCVLPDSEVGAFVQLAGQFGLFVSRVLEIKGKVDGPIVRVLLEFIKDIRTAAPQVKQLEIEISRHEYTQEYIDLVNDFYLNM